MASFDTTRPATGLSAGTVSSFFASIVASFAAWNDARVTRNQLSQLSARELDDIGLSYGDIEEIATRQTR